MRIALTDEQRALQVEARRYFADLMTADVRHALESEGGEEGFGPHERYKEIVRQIGADGWLGIGWPKEYGGQARSTLEQLIFVEEARAAGAPLPLLALATVGPTLMIHGSEEQKRFFLPKILAGELFISIGYSEPNAGTDLASLTTKARRDGDEYVINGQKMWTSAAEYADYIWLATRTDPDAPKHKGITIFLVSTTVPGFRFTPVRTLSGTTTATYYDDVRVPASSVVLGENQGWKLITSQLNNERVMIGSAVATQQLLRDTLRWASETELASGGRVIDQPWVRTNLARVHVNIEALKLFNWKICAGEASPGPAVASAAKIFGSEFNIEACRLLMEVLGSESVVRRDMKGALLRGELESSYQRNLLQTFGGGTNEIQRDMIATVGLGMPRSPR
jgi:3-oxocholest-4-en-26-oyl-CoA dehydrogenase alpha subunit